MSYKVSLTSHFIVCEMEIIAQSCLSCLRAQWCALHISQYPAIGRCYLSLLPGAIPSACGSHPHLTLQCGCQCKVSRSDYGIPGPWASALQCPPVTSSCQYLHLYGAFYWTTKVSLGVQAGPQVPSISPTPTRKVAFYLLWAGGRLNAGPVLATFPSLYHSHTLLAPPK